MHSSTFKAPVVYLTRKELLQNRGLKRHANPLYIKACKFFSAILIDRTQTLETGINFEILDPLHLITGTSDSFPRICRARAREIYHLAGERAITLLWSGGIDSTTALVSLTNELNQRGELSRLKVLLSKESIREFPTFFREVIQNRLHFQIIKSPIYQEINPDDFNVTGEHGDQLFGSDKLKYAVQSGEAFRPYTDILDFVISRKLGTNAYTKDLIQFLAPQVDKSPVVIHTLYDYLWWMNFSMKWQNVTMRLINGLGRDRFQINRNLIHFFQSLPFQNWSVSNHDKKIKTDWQSYKYPAKEFIYRFHQDRDYLCNKEKEQSLRQVIVEPQTEKRISRFFSPLKSALMHIRPQGYCE